LQILTRSRENVLPIRNLHQKPFDEGTRDKLELYREYLREWLLVFINGTSVDILQILDFFAGPGSDVSAETMEVLPLHAMKSVTP
jgi:hypothetical protein